MQIENTMKSGGEKINNQANEKGYFGLSHLLSAILALFPVTNIVLGIILRLIRRKYLGAVLNFIFAPLFYIIDLITIIFTNKLSALA